MITVCSTAKISETEWISDVSIIKLASLLITYNVQIHIHLSKETCTAFQVHVFISSWFNQTHDLGIANAMIYLLSYRKA